MPLNLIIREKRKELGLTQEQVADYLGVSTPAVSKWESGATCPDLTLFPALARLLHTDPNTLLCFQEEPSQQEINSFCMELSRILKEKEGAGSIEESCRFMKQKLREYPRCPRLFHTFALTLQGALIMSVLSQEERKPYEELILSWHQRVLDSDEERLRTQSAYMLASQYLQQEQYEKAQEMIDLLPEPLLLDGRTLQAQLYLRKKEQLPKALELLQKKLLTNVMEVNSHLSLMVKIHQANQDPGKAKAVADIAKQAALLLGLGEYFTCIAPLDIALEKKDREESIRLLKNLMDAASHLWEIKDCPLYDQIAGSFQSGTDIASRILPPILASLKESPEYEFLREDPEFQALLKQYDCRFPHRPC